jgi:hypothetical protein
MAEQEKKMRQKKLSKEGYSPITLEEYKAQSEQMKMSYDEQWVKERSPEAIIDRKIEELTKPAFWSKLTVVDGFFEELKRVIPYFWEMIEKKSRGKKVSKKAVMKGGQPLNLKPLPTYLEILLKLSKGELQMTQANMKKITNVSHARKLKRAKITGRNLLLDIVKYDDSEVIERREREEAEKHSKMNAVIEEVAKGEGSGNELMARETKIMAMTCTYRHPTAYDDSDDEEWFGGEEGAEDAGEEAVSVEEEEAGGDC